MASVFITGSADGLGRMAARLLIAQGHRVVLHARSAARALDAMTGAPGADSVLVGDLARIDEMQSVVQQANALGGFDAVIHNAAVGYREPTRIVTSDGLSHVFAINVLAPYVLTALMHRPKRLVYLSSGLHRSGDASLRDLTWADRSWNGMQAYSDSKLHDAIFAFAVARHWPDVLSNALEPGWVATKMGGANAPDDLNAAPTTQAWLAVSEDAAAKVTGAYFYHQRQQAVHTSAHDWSVQEKLLAACGRLSSVPFPLSTFCLPSTQEPL